MYEVHIESMEFKGKRTIQQHQLVNQVNYCINYGREQYLPVILYICCAETFLFWLMLSVDYI